MSQDSYLLGRGYLASIRYFYNSLNVLKQHVDLESSLYAQHWMWRFQLGYLIHPTIPQDRENLKVADVACGTGLGSSNLD